jgi:hypothetical protein
LKNLGEDNGAFEIEAFMYIIFLKCTLTFYNPWLIYASVPPPRYTLGLYIRAFIFYNPWLLCASVFSAKMYTPSVPLYFYVYVYSRRM